MAKKSKTRTRKNVSVVNPLMFGAAPLLEGEDIQEYSSLLTKIRDAVKPADIIEEMWVQDISDLQWDTLRLRRQKAALINANMYQGLRVVLETLCPESEASDLTSRWSVRHEDAIEAINELLEAGNLTMEAVKAQAVAEIIDEVERFDRMIAISEGRRNVSLREIERRRSAFARALRDATSNAIEDAEFTELEASQLDAEAAPLLTEAVTTEDVEVEETDQVEEEESTYPNSEAAE